MDENIIREHSLSYSKNILTLTGVKEVRSFEEKEVLLSLDRGGISIRGKSLAVSELNVKSGLLRIEGDVGSIAYNNVAEKTSLASKLFR